MGDSQLESTLLHSCLALPKVSFVLRTCPLSHICDTVQEFDQSIRNTLEAISGGPMSYWSWLKVSLPSSCGGFKLCSAHLHAPAIYITSSSSSKQLVESMLGLPPASSSHVCSAVAAAKPEWTDLDNVEVPLRQCQLSHAIDEAVFQRLLCNASSPRARALVLSSGLPHARNWFNVVPSTPLGLHLTDCEFRCFLRYWHGIPLHSNSYPCPECGGSADPFGDHQIGCGGNGDRISHHNAIRDVLFNAAQSAALAPTREAPGLVLSSLSRPANVLLLNWSQSRPDALDVHVISPMQQLTLTEDASSSGHTLRVGVQQKLTEYLSACRSAGIDFVPLVVESLGGWCPDAISTIRSIRHAIGQRDNSTESLLTTKHLFGPLAIALWRGNASCWIHRLPTLPPSLDGLI